MKLVIVIPYFYPKIGGLENYAFNIGVLLKKKYKWKIVIITSNHISNKYVIEKIKGIKVIRLPYQFKISNTPISFKWYKTIQSIISEEKPDIINGHLPVPFIADIASIIAKKKRIPFVLTYQNDLVKEELIPKIFIFLYYLLLGNFTLINSLKIINTTQYYKNYSKKLARFKEKIVIIPPGINLRNKIITYKNNKEKNILFVGQLDKTHRHKGLDLLIEVFSHLIKNYKVNLVIVGTGDDVVRYKKKVEKLNISRSVIFTGYINDIVLSSFYASSDVIVLPSINNSEGFGMVLLEAGAHKKPVIGTKVGGIPYFIDHNINGLLVNPNNKKELENALLTIIKDSKFAKLLGENNYSKTIKNYTWIIQSEKTNKLFSSLV